MLGLQASPAAPIAWAGGVREGRPGSGLGSAAAAAAGPSLGAAAPPGLWDVSETLLIAGTSSADAETHPCGELRGCPAQETRSVCPASLSDGNCIRWGGSGCSYKEAGAPTGRPLRKGHDVPGRADAEPSHRCHSLGYRRCGHSAPNGSVRAGPP